MFRILSALLILALSSQVFASRIMASQVEVIPEQAIVIDGVISRGNIDHLGEYLLETKKPFVDIVINSPGGDVVTGFNFIAMMQAAKANGKVLRCFVNRMAASMAFGILVHCDQRYALNSSFLLWHRARVFVGGLFGTAMTAPIAGGLATQLSLLDSQIFSEAADALGVDKGWVSYHFENETLHTGQSLSENVPDFITSLPSIPGLQEALKNEKLPRSQATGMFGKFRPGQIIYINPKYLTK